MMSNGLSVVMAYVAKVGRKEVGLWKPVAEWKLIKRGRLKGLYRVTLHDGRKALASRIEGVGV